MNNSNVATGCDPVFALGTRGHTRLIIMQTRGKLEIRRKRATLQQNGQLKSDLKINRDSWKIRKVQL